MQVSEIHTFFSTSMLIDQGLSWTSNTRKENHKGAWDQKCQNYNQLFFLLNCNYVSLIE